ncbi:MAG: ATP-binding cassette domain-containing protein [Planctomycetota bacterium]
MLRIPEFRLAARDQVALAGTSGSGKSTFLNVIAGMVRPDSGRVMLDGQEVTALPEAARDALRARTIGYVFQTFHLLGAYSALENVVLGMAFGPGPDPALARALLERLGLGERLHYRPHQLSVGQQQQQLARALANRPKLVLADEPTGNLDPGNAREALGLLRDLCTEHGAALLLVSHDPAVLAQFETRRDFDSINQAGTEVRA